MRTGSGFSTEAVYIFSNMVRRLVTTYKPQYIAAVFEGGSYVSGRHFRQRLC